MTKKIKNTDSPDAAVIISTMRNRNNSSNHEILRQAQNDKKYRFTRHNSYHFDDGGIALIVQIMRFFDRLRMTKKNKKYRFTRRSSYHFDDEESQ